MRPGAASLTAFGTLVFGVGLSGLVPMVVVRVGSVIFGAGLVWLGASLIGDKNARGSAQPGGEATGLPSVSAEAMKPPLFLRFGGCH